jgi:DNA polymerase III delta prime subunit
MGVIGHNEVVSALLVEFPPVALLCGPPSVGKWTTAEHVRRHYQIFEPDVLRARHLDMESAGEVADFASRAASGPAGRVAIVRLDNARPEALNVLLKPLEESGPDMHFMLVSSQPVPFTIESRARRYDFGLLSVEDVTRFLKQKRGMSDALASRLAAVSGGQIRAALESMDVAERKSLVLAAVRALREKDPAALESLADRWRDEHTELLAKWAREAVSHQWRLFNVEETGQVGNLPLRVLVALRRDVRARLVVRSLLVDLLRGA